LDDARRFFGDNKGYSLLLDWKKEETSNGEAKVQWKSNHEQTTPLFYKPFGIGTVHAFSACRFIFDEIVLSSGHYLSSSIV
jgi:hypothetical protein